MYNRRGHQGSIPYLAACLSLAFKPEVPSLLPVTGNSLSNKDAGTEVYDA